MTQVVTFLKQHWLFLLFLSIFLILNARNPFSTRFLIANLEPFPDTLYYTNSAFNLLDGHGFRIGREGRFFTPVVPPLYSLSLMPLYALVSDVRMFYVTNVILGAVAVWFLYKITKHLFPSSLLIQLAVLLLYCTNYLFYWYPQWAMAENLLMPIFLANVWLLVKPFQKSDVWLISVMSIALYATKYASLSFMVAIMILFTIKVMRLSRASKEKKLVKKYQAVWLYWAVQFLIGGGYVLYELIDKQSNIVTSLLSSVRSSTIEVATKVTQPEKYGTTGTGFFNINYASKNLPLYLQWLLGMKLRVLWDSMAPLPIGIAHAAVVGLMGSLLTPKTRRAGVVLVGLIAAGIGFMMFFYAADGRYLMPVVPLLCLGFGYFLLGLKTLSSKLKKPIIFVGLTCVFLAGYTVYLAPALKFQVGLNLKFAETPWFYVSVMELNQLLTTTSNQTSAKPVVISPLPPYFLEYYLKHDVIILPLSNYQEFRTRPVEAWGELHFEDLHSEYRRFIQAGHPVYLARYGIGNEAYLHETLQTVKDTFKVTELTQGCHTQCSIFRVELPDSTQ